MSRVRRHPAAAALGGLLTAAPFAALTGTVEGTLAGMVMGLIGLLIGVPVGAMLAEDAPV